MTESELIKEIEAEERGENPATDAARTVGEAERDFNGALERSKSVTTEAELVKQIGEETL